MDAPKFRVQSREVGIDFEQFPTPNQIPSFIAIGTFLFVLHIIHEKKKEWYLEKDSYLCFPIGVGFIVFIRLIY